MKKPLTHVTDHALVRYLESVHGVDIEGLRERIARNVDLARQHDASGLKVGGVVYKLDGETVITIVSVKDRPKRRVRRA